MAHSFRFEPPEPRPNSVTRPRLLRALLGRWEHRVTVVVGGPGLGKTTLLAQSMAENRLAPRGEDVWLDVGTGDAGRDGLARDLLLAVEPEAPERTAPGGPAARVVADAVWRRAPVEVCLVLDDVHLLPPASPGAAWLTELVDALPANGHLLMASRSALPVPVAKLAPRGDLARVGEGELRFSDDELAGFAARRGVPAGRLSDSGGWPAMAELAAAIDHDMAGEYLWEEVLKPLGADRRRTLAVVCDLGGADDALASAALAEPVELASTLAGVPLIASGSTGWKMPHPLWQSARGLTLDADDRARVRERAVAHLIKRSRYDEAITLAHGAGLTDLIPAVLRAACVSAARPGTAELERWLALSPPSVRSSPAGVLAAAVRATLVAPTEAAPALTEAADRFAEVGDIEGELVAVANQGRIGWWYQDIGLLAETGPRIAKLAATGHPLALSLAALGRSVTADLVGDDDTALAALDDVEPASLDANWNAIATWIRTNILVGLGHADEAVVAALAMPESPDPHFTLTVEGLRMIVHWNMGRVDEVLADLPAVLARVRASGMVHNLDVMLAGVARLEAQVGDVESARAHLAEIPDQRRYATPPARVAMAEASLHLAEGDEAAATAVLAAALEAAAGLGTGMDRRAWRHNLPLSYVLLPDTRPMWDEAELHGFVATARRLAAAVVTARESSARVEGLRTLELPDLGLVRALLHHRFAADLAVGLDAAGHPGAPELFEAIGPVGRAAVRDLATGGPARRTRSVKALLSTVPAPPPVVTEIASLGPLVLRRDGNEVTDPDLRRERLRALLAFLVTHRRTTRAAIMAALWPDLDERSAANNLRVTLTYLLRLLEPWRTSGESAFHVRADTQTVQLVTGEWLRLDVDEFDDHVARAARAEADGTPSLALEHDLAAAALYRGELHTGVPEAEWNTFERDRYRSRFVVAATRAAQLLAARGDTEQAEVVARRAIDVDQWAEAAYAVLVTTALARGDRSAARRALDRCLDALDDLGVEPSAETLRLRRRARGNGR